MSDVSLTPAEYKKLRYRHDAEFRRNHLEACAKLKKAYMEHIEYRRLKELTDRIDNIRNKIERRQKEIEALRAIRNSLCTEQLPLLKKAWDDKRAEIKQAVQDVGKEIIELGEKL